ATDVDRRCRRAVGGTGTGARGSTAGAVARECGATRGGRGGGSATARAGDRDPRGQARRGGGVGPVRIAHRVLPGVVGGGGRGAGGQAARIPPAGDVEGSEHDREQGERCA